MSSPIDLFYFSAQFGVYVIREGGRWTTFRPDEVHRLIAYLPAKSVLFPEGSAQGDAGLPQGLRAYLEYDRAQRRPRPKAPTAPLSVSDLNLDELGL